MAVDISPKEVRETYRGSRAFFIGKNRGSEEHVFFEECDLFDISEWYMCLRDLKNCKYDYLVIELPNIQYPDLFI